MKTARTLFCLITVALLFITQTSSAGDQPSPADFLMKKPVSLMDLGLYKFTSHLQKIMRDRKIDEIEPDAFALYSEKKDKFIARVYYVERNDSIRTDRNSHGQQLKNTFFLLRNELGIKQNGEPYRSNSVLKEMFFTEKGKALFVDCLMGVGKTFSIVKTFGQNPNLSAVIFMPTNKLCEKMVQDLKSEIFINAPTIRDKYPGIIDQEESDDEPDDPIDQMIGMPAFKRTREFLEREVCHADGINKDECPKFNKIIKRYRENWLSKQDICQSCEKNKTCRFLLHDEKSPHSRIIITTHHQYDRFINHKQIRKCDKNGYCDKRSARERDLFIIDEDMVLSQCYQPISVEYEELRSFLAPVCEFIDQHSGSEKISDTISSLFGKVALCSKTSFIWPLDTKFKFPDIIQKELNVSTGNLLKLLNSNEELPGLVGNHLEMIEDAIRLGLVVQKYGKRYRIYFHNRKFYDLLKLPPHVFFDGTLIVRRLLKKKLRNVSLHRMEIKVKPLWELKVWQNKNSDLPKKGTTALKEYIEKFLSDLLNYLGPDHKHFILSTEKAIEKFFLEFIEQKFPRFDCIFGHYGYLRGINEARGCDIKIMLGTYPLSDAVEISMSLEFIQRALPKKAITPTQNYFWTGKGGKSKRVYKKKYDITNDISKAVRNSEHRQAMARTRYIFHDVDFYVVSKVPVSEYEPYAEILDMNYREDIFSKRKERSDSKYPVIRDKLLSLLAKIMV